MSIDWNTWGNVIKTNDVLLLYSFLLVVRLYWRQALNTTKCQLAPRVFNTMRPAWNYRARRIGTYQQSGDPSIGNVSQIYIKWFINSKEMRMCTHRRGSYQLASEDEGSLDYDNMTGQHCCCCSKRIKSYKLCFKVIHLSTFHILYTFSSKWNWHSLNRLLKRPRHGTKHFLHRGDARSPSGLPRCLVPLLQNIGEDNFCTIPVLIN